jgi:ribonuclease HI
MSSKKKYYVVWQGQEPGIYDSWAACQQQIKGYPGAKYKSFKTKDAAEAAFFAGYGASVKSASASAKPVIDHSLFEHEIDWNTIAVDAACSGNPGKMEYQGVFTKDGTQIFHQAFPLGTNNIGEFLALVHGLAWLQQQNSDLGIYTDSRNAMKWIKGGKCRTTLKRTSTTARLYQVIERAENWLANNSYSTPILKWNTERWGEIPADFGRK